MFSSNRLPLLVLFSYRRRWQKARLYKKGWKRCSIPSRHNAKRRNLHFQEWNVKLFLHPCVSFSFVFIDRSRRLCVCHRLNLICFPNNLQSSVFYCFRERRYASLNRISIVRIQLRVTWIIDFSFRKVPTEEQAEKRQVTGCYRFNNFFLVSTNFVVLKPLLCKN